MKHQPQKSVSPVGPWFGGLALFAFVAVAHAGSSPSPRLTALVAQVESLNCIDNSFQALGLHLRAVDEFVLATLCDSPSDDSLRYAVITAIEESESKLVATSVTSIGALYVPGASSVYIVGEVSESKADVGLFSVSGSAAISIAGFAPALGERIEVVGTQPQVGGAIVATSVSPAIAIDGLADRILEIVNPVGSTNGIIGSGIQTSGIIGSGVSSNGIIGSGIQTSGIIGSGVFSNGIIGSGIQTSGIIGSGVSLNGIIGSGIQTSGIIGSGVSSTGIIGSGIQTSGIIGSGKTRNGIIGSGVQTSGIIGSGASTSGIIGSGVQTSGIIGSGVSTNGIIGSGIASTQ